MKEKDGNFTVKCICDNGSDWFEEGKIYKVKDFYIRFKNGEKLSRRIANLNELNYAMAARFELAVENTTTITIYNTPGSPKVSAVMRRGDTVIKSAKAMYNPNDALEGKPFSFEIGMEKAIDRLFGREEVKPATPVKKVKRTARVREWIEITDGYPSKSLGQNYKNGDIFECIETEACSFDDIYVNGVKDIIEPHEYVVLENYCPETPAKFRKAKVGDRIKIVKSGYHEPIVNIGDIFTVTKSGGWYAETDTGNVFDDSCEEYIILSK